MRKPPERLGSFYLGAEYDLDAGEHSGEAINYDARDLTTHAVCVGMTGSGKTGLCVGLLEEAAMDRVPAILIDPKGDITNLLLQFPDMQPQDFQPWINPDDARRSDQTIEEYAEATSVLWRKGLADWGITSERIRILNETTDYTVFTPGSEAGIPISILSRLVAPELSFATHAEEIREQISGTVAAMLGLVDIKADPIRSREAILLSNIFEHFWQQGQNLDLAQLILSIQTPPVRQIGVFDVDTFYPQKDRFALAMAFNNLMAAPTFQSWLKGEPLDIDRLFYTSEGKPLHSIFYIAHLSDSERMFFVTLLLESVLSWMRRQTGTTSLRALLYFDEIFGFFPPTAEPPSKRPLLTILKQARAFGLGTILVTQNPVDIDYKGLTNAGTWFIGKLQAERDKSRVLAGLEGAIAESGSMTKVDYSSLINRLGSRVFLLHNVHDEGPIIFQTRWVMSYLRGPLTRPQVSQLMNNRKQVQDNQPMQSPSPIGMRQTVQSRSILPPSVSTASASTLMPSEPSVPDGFAATAPSLGPTLEQVFLPIELGERAAARQLVKEEGNQIEFETHQLVYKPAILSAARVRFLDRKRKIDEQETLMLLAPAPPRVGGVDWASAAVLRLEIRDLLHEAEYVEPEQGPFFAPAPERANSIRKLKSIQRDLSDWLYHNKRFTVNMHSELELHQIPGEHERDFKIRLQQAARERRDAEVDQLEKKIKTQIDRLQVKLRREERELAEDEAEYSSRKREEWIGIGESVMGIFTGRRTTRSLSRAATKRRMTSRAKQNIEESQEIIADLQEDIADLENGFKASVNEITRKWADLLDEVETDEIKPRRTDVQIDLVALAWLPSWLIHYRNGRRKRRATVAAYRFPQ